MRLRPLTRADVPELAELTHRCHVSQRDWAGPGITVPSVAGEIAEWETRLSRPGAWTAGIEDAGGRLAGACAFAAARGDHHDGELVEGLAHISAVFVDPAHRRRGIARRLVEAAEAELRDRGYRGARLYTLEGSPAEQLYAALGWRRTDERKRFPAMDLMTVMYVKELRPGT